MRVQETKVQRNLVVVVSSLTLHKKIQSASTKFRLGQEPITTIPNEIAEKFNRYFTQVETNLASKIPNINTSFQSYLPKPVMKSIFVLNTNEIEVEKIVNQLENKMYIGYDGIRFDIIKKVIKSIAQPLAYLVNLSIETGVVPDDLMSNILTPAYCCCCACWVTIKLFVTLDRNQEELQARIASKAKRVESYATKSEVAPPGEYAKRSADRSVQISIFMFYFSQNVGVI